MSSRRDPSCYKVVLRVPEEIQGKRYTGITRGPEEVEADVKVFEECLKWSKTVAKNMLRFVEEIQDAVDEIEEFQ